MKKILYNCKECGNTIVTEVLSQGTIPHMIKCKDYKGCSKGMMVYTQAEDLPYTLIASHYWKYGKDSKFLVLNPK